MNTTGEKSRYGGWSDQGLVRFNELCSLVQKARLVSKRKLLELYLLNQFNRDANAPPARECDENEDHGNVDKCAPTVVRPFSMYQDV